MSPKLDSPISRPTKTALVTGGAGLIGSHIVDAPWPKAGRSASSTAWSARRTAMESRPGCRDEVEFLKGDVRNRRPGNARWTAIDIVFHEAAYGGYMPEIAKFIARQLRRHRADAGDDPRPQPAGPQGRPRLVPGGLQRGRLPLPDARPLLRPDPPDRPARARRLRMSAARTAALPPTPSRPTRRPRWAARTSTPSPSRSRSGCSSPGDGPPASRPSRYATPAPTDRGNRCSTRTPA